MTARDVIAGLATLAIVGLLLAALWFALHPTSAAPEPIGGACTLEAKQCPDGSYVGRVPPSCDFAPCPFGTSTPDVKG